MASFSNDGRTITIAPAPQASASPQSLPAISTPAPTLTASPLPPPSASAGAIPAAPTVPALPSGIHFLVAVDASHGGDERGAALTSDLPEKDVTLAIAHRVRQEMENRGITVLMLRDSDVSLSPDQRAALANMAGASVYICIHASTEGNGVRLYTATMPAADENRGPFVAWNTAQNSSLPLSQLAVGSVSTELQNRTAVRVLTASMRPLNSVTAAAFAVEVAPPGSDVLAVASPQYQQLVAAAVATGIASFRDRPAGHP